MSHLPQVAKASFTQSAGLYYSLDADGCLLQWNAEFEQLSGHEAADLSGMNLLEMMVDADRPLVQLALEDTLRRGMNEFCARMRTPKGAIEYLFRLLTNVDVNGDQRLITGVAQPRARQQIQKDDLEFINSHLREQQNALLQLSRSRFNHVHELEQLLAYTTEIVARTLHVERVSFWLFDETRKKIECQDLFCSSLRDHVPAPVLHAVDFPAYFNAVEEDRCIAADDAVLDPITSAFTETYLKPLGIGALLDAPLRIAGQVVGVLCCEHVGEPRHWRLDEQNFAASVADHIALSLEARQHRQSRDAYRDLHQYIDTLMDSTSEGIIAMDRDLHCTFANQAAIDILGFNTSELQGQDVHKLIQHSAEDGCVLQKADSKMLRSISEAREFQVDSAVLWTKENHCIHVRYSANPIYEHGKISGVVLVFHNMSESLAMISQMDYLASHDALTGLHNRYEFDQRLKDAVKGAKLKNEQHVLFYMDLDQFKVVNDTCGHLAGDELLKQLSRELQKEVRNDDMLARLGGDEFGVLLSNCDLKQARQAAKKLQRTVRNFRFQLEDKTFSIGVSIGIVEIVAHSQSNANILSLADSACFLAKEEGRNRIHVYHQNDEDLARQQGEMQWVSRIQQALEHNLLEIYCQRIVPVGRSHQGTGHVEVLVRMIGENGEIIPPGAFIPAAERYNLMSELDRWVIDHTFAWLSENRKSMERLITTINISGQSLGDEHFLDYLIAMLSNYGIAPHSVCFEITETAAVGNLSSAVNFIKDLKSLGCKFALDDFGSGMSSFTYLKNLPVDYLKIDGSLVKDIATDAVNFSMVEAINRVGRVMGLQTIAEFVENQAILEKLEQIGVDYAQGFGIAKPVPSKQFRP